MLPDGKSLNQELVQPGRGAQDRSQVRYVWIYTEQPRWWTNERLPPAYIDALRAAKQE